MRRVVVFAALGAALVAASAAPAGAFFHRMIVEELYGGHPASPDAHYVVLRMTANGQYNVGGQQIRTFFADGTPGPAFGTFANNVQTGIAGYKILMATSEAVRIFGVPADHVTTGRLPFPSGRVCFSLQVEADCVAYGAYTGNNGEYGQPAAALEVGKALHRIQYNEAADNNATDFELALPMPIDNSNFTVSPDGDSDLVPDSTDCAPSDPSLWFAPPLVSVTGVRLSAPDGGAALLTWSSLAASAGSTTVYDLVGGSVGALGSAGGYGGVASCAARGATGSEWVDPALVLEGDGRFWLVRGRNGCGVGSYGDGSVPPGAPDPRDALDDPALDPCR